MLQKIKFNSYYYLENCLQAAALVDVADTDLVLYSKQWCSSDSSQIEGFAFVN